MKTFVLIIVLFVFASSGLAQSCNCTTTLTKEGAYDGKLLGYKPGQTICIAAGSYNYFYFKNIVGTATQPIKIINCGGQVTVGTETGQNGIQFYDSKYVKLTGTGDSRYKYGINLTKTPANYSGIVVTGFSSDFEIEKVEVSGTGFAGIMIKYDPTCDPATWRGTFSMYNIKVHDTYIHDTGSEGMYIGSSFWNTGITLTCDGVAKTVYPHNIYGLRIYNNITDRTGAEGIQYACAPSSLVYSNVVKNTGVSPFSTYQNNGIQASGGVSGHLYNNIVQNVPGNGIIIVGHTATNMIYNNLITNVTGAGVFCDNRAGTPPKNSIIFTNNTIVNCGLEGFRLYDELDAITLTNNAVIQSAAGKIVLTSTGMQINQQANFYQSSLSSALTNKVIDAAYKPLAGSPLVDKGMLNTSWNITTDLQWKPRPKGVGMDIGAYEFQPSAGARLSSIENSKENVEEVTRIYAFPSPCTDELSLSLNSNEVDISDYKVYNMLGLQVLAIKLQTPAHQIKIHTSDFPVGEYIVRVVTTDFQFFSERFIKQ